MSCLNNAPVGIICAGKKTASMTDKSNIKKNLANKIGTSLSRIRRDGGWTQGGLAEKIGVETETISRFERGATTPSLVTLQMLADTMGTTITELIGEASVPLNNQANWISEWLITLSPSDREFVTRHLKELCNQLRQK